MNEDYSTIEQNLRRILEQAEELTEETDKQNSESQNVPTNPFAKRQFNKKLRSSRCNQPLRSESEERLPLRITESHMNIPQASCTSERKSNPSHSAHKLKQQKSSTKQKKGLAEYLWDDRIERKVEENNRLFTDIIEYLMNLREKVNSQIRQASCDISCRSGSKREKGPLVVEDKQSEKNIEAILGNIKLYFEQVLQPQLLGDVTGKKYPKHIETVIEFENIEQGQPSSKNNRRTLPQPREPEEADHPINSSISYFRRSLAGTGPLKTLENSRKDSRVDKRSLENTMKGCLETSGMDTQKKSSVYEMILNERKSRAKKTK